MNDELYEKLKKYLPLYVAVGLDPDTGDVCGTTEHSFAIVPTKDFVRVWWSGTAYSIIGEMQIDGKKDADNNKLPGHFIFDVLSDDCPIEIDFEKWLSNLDGNTDKYNKRNIQFKVKDINNWQLKALTAEQQLNLYKTKYLNTLALYNGVNYKYSKICDIVNPYQEDDE